MELIFALLLSLLPLTASAGFWKPESDPLAAGMNVMTCAL